MTKPFLESCPLVVSTLSPVHVGCAEDYQPTEYVMDEGIFYLFNPVEALADNQAAREELLKICNGQGETVIKDVQKFFFKRKEELIPFSSHRIPVGAEVQDFYDRRVGKTIQAGNNTVNKLNIERTSHVLGDEHPILPGSSLKGSIRTALLDFVHGGKPLANIKDAENRKKNWKELAPIATTLKLCVPKDFAQDPMRLIRMGDLSVRVKPWVGNDILFALNFKTSGGVGKGPYQTLECLPGLMLEFMEGDLTFLDPSQVRHTDADVTWGFKKVVARCNRFYQEVHLIRELRQLEAYLDPSWRDAMLRSLGEGGGLKRLLDSGRAFLLRVGRHSGAESVTLNGARRIYQPQYKKWVSKPSTTWLAGDSVKQEKNLLPFGWLLVELNDEKRRPLVETVPEIAKLAEGRLEKKKESLAASDRKLEELRKKIEGRRLQEEKDRVERQQRETEEQECKARLAAMSENQRRIEGFRKQMEATRLLEPVGGKLWGDIQILIRDVEGKRQEWLREELEELAQVCNEELPKKLKGADKKLKELRQRLAHLMGGAS
ncbi:MAG: hypothetical protein HQL74_14910 [Magnetococcales bacterium]|nr:hypothetical protein [Magnetococcales bacterium]